MAEILAGIDEAFDSDPLIDEIGIIMIPPPPNLVLVDHKLGLSFKILKPLFEFAICEFYAIMRSAKMSEEMLLSSIIAEKVLRLTRATLLVKADMPMLYNLRKTIILAGLTTHNINAELNFLKVLFTKHPKSPSSWQHRRWCLTTRWSNTQTKDLSLSDVPFSSSDMDVELSLCSAMSESYPKNYYSWLHRLWLLQYMQFTQLESELDFTRAWLISHVSDHSASNHRVQVILRIISLISDFETREEEVLQSQSQSQSAALESITNSTALGSYLSSLPCSISSDHTLHTTERMESLINDNENKNEKNNTACHVDKRRTKASDDEMKFLEYMFQDSKQLIVLRPGSETLWGLLRAIANLILQNIPWSIKKESGQHYVTSSPVTLKALGPSTDTPSYLNPINFIIDLESVNTETVEKSTSDNGFDAQNVFSNSVKLNAADDTINIQHHDVLWLADWLKNETAFCQNCIDNVYAWNYATHRQMALRYCCFIQQRILVHYSNTTAASEIQQHHYEDKDESDCFDDVSQRYNTHLLKPFTDVVRLSLEKISKQLEIEGKEHSIFSIQKKTACILYFLLAQKSTTCF